MRDHFTERRGDQSQRCAPGLEFRKGQQVADHRRQTFGMGLNGGGEARGRGRINRSPGQGFGITTDHGDRCAQLVGHVGHEIAAHPFEAFEIADVVEDRDGSGWDALPDIRARQPEARIVILSGADTTAEEARRVEAVLLKSQVSPKELIDALGSRIRSSRRRRSQA